MREWVVYVTEYINVMLQRLLLLGSSSSRTFPEHQFSSTANTEKLIVENSSIYFFSLPQRRIKCANIDADHEHIETTKGTEFLGVGRTGNKTQRRAVVTVHDRRIRRMPFIVEQLQQLGHKHVIRRSVDHLITSDMCRTECQTQTAESGRPARRRLALFATLHLTLIYYSATLSS